MHFQEYERQETMGEERKRLAEEAALLVLRHWYTRLLALDSAAKRDGVPTPICLQTASCPHPAAPKAEGTGAACRVTSAGCLQHVC